MKSVGRPRHWATEEDFIASAETYMQHCEASGKLANIMGFCAAERIDRQTYYNQRGWYPKAFEIVECMLEDSALNFKNQSMGIFYLKNKFGYRDRTEIDASVNNPFAELTTEELKRIASLKEK